MEERESVRSPLENKEGRSPSRLLTSSLALLFLSACYLLGPARASMGKAATAAVLLHIGVGLLLIVPVGFALNRHRGTLRGAGKPLLWTAFGACAATGIVMIAMAAQGHSTAREHLVWWVHLLSGFCCTFIVGHWLLRKRSATRIVVPASAILSVMLLSTLGFGGAMVLPRYDAASYYRDLTATNGAQVNNPLFPAGMRLSPDSSGGGPASSYSCGQVGCHEAAHRQWLSSGHQLAASDPVYRKTASEYAAHSGTPAAKWCTGCHDPMSVARLTRPVASRPLTEQKSEDGVGCVACHAITDVSARTGNGRFTLLIPQDYPFSQDREGWRKRMHDFLLRVRPSPHQAAYLKPHLHSSPELCSACHRQSFNVPQNGYQFVHGADEWGTWQSGPFSGRTARTAGLTTEQPKTCQECHFRRRSEGPVSHASLGSNAWLPLSTGDDGRGSRVEGFLGRSHLSVDIFALRRRTGDGQAEEWIAPLDSLPSGATMRSRESALLDIVVTNRNVGHEFPAGYLDIEEAWLEVTLRDGAGEVMASSGLLARDVDSLPPGTHAYRMTPLDRDGARLAHHELDRHVTTATRRAIAPGCSDIARYRLKLPMHFIAPLTVQARLRYRSLRPDFANWAKPGTTVPVTVLAEARVKLPSPGKTRSIPAAVETRSVASMHADTAQRFVEYGLGLLAPKEGPEAARARRAFLIAQRLAPNRPEAFIGLGRAYLVEPALIAARSQFDTALKLSPGNPAAQADLGVIYSKQGEYDRALRLLEPLALRYPQDSALQFDLGLTLFRSGDYAGAADALQHSLAADPDNSAAHFQLKQCYQHLHRIPEARREEAIGQYLAEDRMAALLVPPYLRTHPDDREAAMPIPEHLLRPMPAP